jgi:hypothetical protein
MLKQIPTIGRMASDHLGGDTMTNLGARALGVKNLPQRAGVADIQDGGLKTKGRKVGGLEAKSLKAKSLRARGQYEAPRV